MKKISILLLLCSFISIAVFSQSAEIKGKVTDSANAPLAGVSVVVSGTSRGTQTNSKGEFTLRVTDNKKVTLIFSYTGYKSKNVKADPTSSITVSLEKDVNQIDDVVVVGYQTVRRKDVMASVASVDAKQLRDIPINSAAEMLNGRLAGVTATTAEGSPDAEVRIRVRGGMSITQDNSPLYIVDGVQIENALNVIAPQDIQTIDVLKDAAATSIYGARGANGVIIITTKSGKPGKMKMHYNGFVGVKTLAKRLPVLSPYEFLVYNYERSLGSTADSTNFRNDFGTWDTLVNYKNVEAVDWQGEMMGRTGIASTHNAGFSGGTQKATYNFNYTHNNDKAIVLNSEYKRHLLNFKGDYKITNKIKVGAGFRYTNQEVLGAGVSDDKGSAYNRLRSAVKYRPFLSTGQDIDDNDPLAEDNVGNGLSLVNPILLARAEYRTKRTNALNLNANVTYNINKRFSFRSVFGYDSNEQIDKQFSDSLTPYSRIQGAAKPIISLDSTSRKVITNSNVLTYSLKNYKKKHDLTVILGQETYQLETHTHGRTIENYPQNTYPNKAFNETNLGTVKGLPRLFKSKYTSLSIFSRINYGYKGKYMAEVNVRADGSSKFATDERWGYFPSGSLAWVISKEDFLKNSTNINNLKLRIGYGTVGNNRIGDYLYQTTFRNDQLFYSLNGNIVPAFTSTALVNENLRWESLVNQNFGLDIGLLRGRLDVSFDYYMNQSKDLLLDVPIASTYGYVTQLQNIGETSNKGWELQVNATIIRKPKNNFTWSANFNISHNKNTVEALGRGMKAFFPAPSWGVSGQPTDYIVRIGDPVGSMWGLVNEGFYKVSDFDYNATTNTYTLKAGVVNNTSIIGTPQPGSIKFRDLNGDGVVDVNNDRQIIGDPTPDFTGGLNQQFTYKQWDASIFVNFVIGGDIYNANNIEFINGYTPNANMLGMVENRWRTIDANGQRVTDPTALTALNANATLWRPITGAGAFFPHSWAIEDGSFLRLNNITIGYTLPVKALAKLKLDRLRFYATANNLAVITGYSGFDPEVSVRRSPLTPNLDYSAYPKSRTYIFGVNVSF